MKVAILIALMLTVALCGQKHTTNSTNNDSGYGTEIEAPVEEVESVEEQGGNNTEVDVVVGNETTTEAPSSNSGWSFTEVPLSECNRSEILSAVQWGAQQMIAKVLNCTGIDANGFNAQLLWAGISQQSFGKYWQFVVALDNSNGVTINATYIVGGSNGEYSLGGFNYVNKFSVSLAAEIREWQANNTCGAQNEEESTQEEAVEEEESGNNTEVEVPVEEEPNAEEGVEEVVEEEQVEEEATEEQSGNNTQVEIVINSNATSEAPSNYNGWNYTQVPLSECNTTDILSALSWGAQIVINKVVNCTGIEELTFTAQPLWIGHYQKSSSDYYQFVLALNNNNGLAIKATLVVRVTNGEYSLKELHHKNTISSSLAAQIKEWQANNTC